MVPPVGHSVAQETTEYLEGGFRSEHFSDTRLTHLVGDCTIGPLTEIGYPGHFLKAERIGHLSGPSRLSLGEWNLSG